MGDTCATTFWHSKWMPYYSHPWHHERFDVEECHRVINKFARFEAYRAEIITTCDETFVIADDWVKVLSDLYGDQSEKTASKQVKILVEQAAATDNCGGTKQIATDIKVAFMKVTEDKKSRPIPDIIFFTKYLEHFEYDFQAFDEWYRSNTKHI